MQQTFIVVPAAAADATDLVCMPFEPRTMGFPVFRISRQHEVGAQKRIRKKKNSKPNNNEAVMALRMIKHKNKNKKIRKKTNKHETTISKQENDDTENKHKTKQKR